MIFFIIILLFIFFTIILLIKPRCPECGGTMYDIDVHNGRIVYKCNYCGEEWIYWKADRKHL